MAKVLELQTVTSPPNDNTISSTDLGYSDSTWNYIWDEKLCKTSLKLFKPTVYVPPVLPLIDVTDPKRFYMCPVEDCNKSFTNGSTFRIHLKRHVPDSQKPYQCNGPQCKRAFVKYSELVIHNRIHTGERPYECEQCGNKFRCSHQLTKHLRTHTKERKIVRHDSEASDSNDSSSCSLVQTDLDVSIKQEMDTDSDTETKADQDEQRHEMEEVKMELTNSIAPSLTAFYPFSSDSPIDTNETQIKEPDVAKDFKFNNISSNSLGKTNLEVSVKQETGIYLDPIQFEAQLKQEITTETTDEYIHRFESIRQCEIKDIKNESQMTVEPYFTDFYASNDPMSTSAIHRLSFPMPIAPNNIKSEFKSTYSIDSKSLSETSMHNIESEPVSSKAKEDESNNVKKPHKCAVEGCDRVFKVPYELKRHSLVHTKVKTFECNQCKKRFLRTDHLDKHIKIHCRIQKPASR